MAVDRYTEGYSCAVVILSVLGFATFFTGFAAPLWTRSDSDGDPGFYVESGIWYACTYDKEGNLPEKNCQEFTRSAGLPGWMRAVQAFMVVGLAAALVAVSACLTWSASCLCSRTISGIILLAAASVLVVCCLICLSVFAAKNKNDEALYYGYTLTAASAVFFLIVIVIGVRPILLAPKKVDTVEDRPWSSRSQAEQRLTPEVIHYNGQYDNY